MLAAGSASAAERFDLACTGKANSLEAPGVSRAEVTRFRIDLLARQWCGGGCDRLNEVVRFNPNEIVLQDVRGSDVVTLQVVNRLSGSVNFDQYVGKIYIYSHLTCAPQPFSGFPLPKF